MSKPKDTFTVLLAEDELFLSRTFENRLTLEGYTVLLAHDGEDAIQMILKEKPDLVILDIMMPKMNGYEICEKLRETSDTRLTPIIMLTAQSQIKDKLTGLKIGADDYITKPFNPLELAARVERIIKRCNETKTGK